MIGGGAPPKPPRREPKPRRPIRRSSLPRRRSEKADARDARDGLWSSLVRARAKGICERCRRQYATDAHHIRGKKAHPALRYDLTNGVALCRKCHDWAHAYPTLFRAEVTLARSKESLIDG